MGGIYTQDVPLPKAGWEAYTTVINLSLRLDGRHIHRYTPVGRRPEAPWALHTRFTVGQLLQVQALC